LSTPGPDISDEQVLDLLANPDTNEKGFRHLMEKYQERLYWHIRRLVTDHEDANDVLQNCFIKVYRNIRGFKGNSKLYTWLYRIATNESITFMKKKNRRAAASLDDAGCSLAEQLEADPYFNGDETQRRLQEAFRRLPEKQRIVFNLRYFEEMPYRDMSDILGISVGGLKASYHHAVKKIEHYFRSVEIQ
jgi:RNA polymerase sigma factor (sigma-70 family)